MIKQENQQNYNLTVAIQAGGKSSRMGKNKALMMLSGITLIERVIDRVEPIARELFIVANDTSEYSFLGVRSVPDSIPGKGAIGGLYTAIDLSENDFVAVVACDLPFVNNDILLKGLDLVIQNGADVAIPKSGETFFEPLHAVYRRDSCKGAIYQAIMNHQWRMTSWLQSVNVIEMDLSLCRELDPSGLAFFNVNTQEDFIEAEKLIQSSTK